ncbi:hypothetical protein [Polycladidibacter hongkongensis]|uniref:hypothetical protein n=1 Tax=Polycladidibacter hongkongensis TaxID=1647556 RepID=UPI00082E49CC|nr:hypothetical protein [Pseudovibrio hongkongensis]
MAGIISSEDNPIRGFTRQQADIHFKNGGGVDVYVERTWYMNEGPGSVVSLGGSRAIQDLRDLPAGSKVTFGRDLYERTPNVEPDEIAFDYYDRFGNLSDEGYIYGDASFVVRGTVEVLDDGRLKADLELRPYDDQWGFENNGQGGFFEALRGIGGWLTGNGTAFDIKYRGPGPGRKIEGIFTHEELTKNIGEYQGYADSTECFGPDTPIDMWPLDPEFAPDPANPNKIFDQDAVRAKIWKKPIAMIRKGDVVVSFDKNDNLMLGRVTRTFENESKILLDYFGTRVTPGHVYFRPDSKKTDKFECLLDILRDDGMIQNVEGKNIRAATNVPVGDPRDGFVWAITQERKDGILVEKERARIRLGTRFIVDGKTSQCVADVIEAKGGVVGDDELIRFGDVDPAPFVWEHGATLPKPEDFVLQASGTTLTDIYKAGEWESRRPHMPAPMVMDGGPVQPLSATAPSAMPRNQPLNLQPVTTSAPAPKRTARPPMNRKQRKAIEAKQRKAAKMRNRAAG